MKRLALLLVVALGSCVPEVHPAHASVFWYMVGNANGAASQASEDQTKIDQLQTDLNACRAELAKVPSFKMDRQQ